MSKSNIKPFILLFMTLILPCGYIVLQYLKGLDKENIIQSQRVLAMKRRSMNSACRHLRRFWLQKEKHINDILTKNNVNIANSIVNAGIADAFIWQSQLIGSVDMAEKDNLVYHFAKNYTVFNQSYGFNPSPVNGYWQYRPIGGLYYLLFKKEKIFSTLQKIVKEYDMSEAIRFLLMFLTEQRPVSGINVAVGPQMPNAYVVDISSRNQAEGGVTKADFYTVGIMLVIVCITLGMTLVFSKNMHSKLCLADLKNDMVATVSHEMKTPLASSRVLLETLQENPGLDHEAVQKYYCRLHHENRRLSDLVDQFLTFSRLEKKHYHFSFRCCTFDDIKRAIDELINSRFPADSERIVFHFNASDLRVNIDLKSIMIALGNLVENALKYSAKKTIVYIDLRQEKNSVSVAVKDEGIGIEETYISTIFTKFFRVDQHLSQEHGGCGLGLSIVAYIVNAHKASIDVESEPEKGSTFRVKIPVTAEFCDV